MNNTANFNYDIGIHLFYSSDNNIVNNTANSNNWSGINLFSSSDNIMNNTASNNCYGIYLYSSNHNKVMNNNVNFNKEYDIYLYGSNYNIITNNEGTIHRELTTTTIIWTSLVLIISAHWFAENQRSSVNFSHHCCPFTYRWFMCGSVNSTVKLARMQVAEPEWES